MTITRTYRATLTAEFTVEFEEGEEPDEMKLDERAYAALFANRDQWEAPADLGIERTLLHVGKYGDEE